MNKKIILSVIGVFVVVIVVFAFSSAGGFLKGSLRRIVPPDGSAIQSCPTLQLAQYPKDFTDVSLKYIEQDGWNIILHLDNQVLANSKKRIKVASGYHQGASSYVFYAEDFPYNLQKVNLSDVPLKNDYVEGGFSSDLKALCGEYTDVYKSSKVDSFEIKVSLDPDNDFKEANESNNNLSFNFSCLKQ
ncbi:hypothetical protein HZA40_02250 [Candidatus Peregrinibacteria bacterium]|nr:hypothetical protein [Candidatus Peregrinibacteria bacterium]